MILADIDWTPILVAAIAAVPSTLGFVLAYLIHRDQQTPSGDRIGEVVERTHDLAAANSGMLVQQQQAIGRLNDDSAK